MIRKYSKKRAAQNRKYSALRKKFLEDNDCQAGLPGCSGEATQVHHSEGRIGDKLCDVLKFVAVCASCHRIIEDNPKLARDMGLSKSRLHN